MNLKYTAEDAGKQKFVIGNFYRWEMVEDKDIKQQINEYHKLLEELKAENINLQEEFVAGILIEKLPESWNDYKQQLKHKHKQLSLADLITHIVIEETNRKQFKEAKAKEIASKANLVQGNNNNRYNSRLQNSSFVPKVNNSNTFKKKGYCFVCGKPNHHASQCRDRVKNENPYMQNANMAPRQNFNMAPRPNPYKWSKPSANVAQGDDIISAVISQINLVANVKDWVVDSGATRHICANKDVFISYASVGSGEEHVYLGDSRTINVEGKGKVLLKLTSGKTLALNDVLHVPSIRANLISVALLGKAGVKVTFESDKIVMTKNNILVGKGYCNNGLFVLNVSM